MGLAREMRPGEWEVGDRVFYERAHVGTTPGVVRWISGNGAAVRVEFLDFALVFTWRERPQAWAQRGLSTTYRRNLYRMQPEELPK